MRICVLGAGAIGGFVGARLAAAGQPVSALARGETLAALRKHGWRLLEGDRLVAAPVEAVSDDAEELGEQDVVVLAVKAPALPAAMVGIRPLIGPETVVLTAMNGVPWWFFDRPGAPLHGLRLASVDPGGALAAALPSRQVIGCVVHVSCGTPEPGLVRHVSGDGLILGEVDGADSARLRALVDLLCRAGFEATASPVIQADVWYKLWGNMTMNPVSALTAATVDLVLDDELVSAFCHSVMAEAQRIGARIGYPIEQTPAERSELTRALGAVKTSMLQDAEAGRPLELDALIGSVHEIGRAVDVATPATDALFGLSRLAAGVRGTYPRQRPASPAGDRP